jgi:alkylresorcinol/alkylpyrone synthase
VASIASLATALPPHVLTSDELKRIGRRVYRDVSGAAWDRLVDRTAIDRRYLIRPVEDLLRPRTLEETSCWFRDGAVSLARDALETAIVRARIDPAQIDAIVTASSTGYLVPSIDAHLIDGLGLRQDVRRIPLATLGCAGGVAGLVQAAAATVAHPTVAFVAVELPTITYRPGDRAKANLISSTLFGDGAAAAIVTRDGSGPQIIGGKSWLHRDSRDAMGFQLTDDGFRVLLSPRVPDLAPTNLKDLVDELRADRPLEFFALHPGGRKVLERVEAALGLARADTQCAHDVLREHGNMSSPTVLFVLERLLASRRAHGYGLAAAFGPGFATELMLVRA